MQMQQFMGMKVPPLGWLLSRLVDFRCGVLNRQSCLNLLFLR